MEVLEIGPAVDVRFVLPFALLVLVNGAEEEEEEVPKNRSSCSFHVFPALFRSFEDEGWFCFGWRRIVNQWYRDDS